MVFIKSPNNQTLTLDINPDTTTFGSLIHQISQTYRIPVENLRLFLSPRLLSLPQNGAVLLSSLGISSNSMMTIHMPLLGGMHQADDSIRDQWDGIPEIDDHYPLRNIKKQRSESLSGTVLSSKLDRLSDTVSVLTVLDPNGHLTDQTSMKITSDADMADIKKARSLLNKLIWENPSHPGSWIAAARLEDVVGKCEAARQIIRRGCEFCPKNEDVWLEAFGLASNDEKDAKSVIRRAITMIPDSVELWMVAARMEKDDLGKIRVLKLGLQCIPHSARLWMAVVELASEEDARFLVKRAVKQCTSSVELWLARTRMESDEDARKVLNEARCRFPYEPAIWIAAARLQEANGDATMAGKLVGRGIRALRVQGVEIDREVWMKEAEAAERAGSIVTCQAIRVGMEEEDRRRAFFLGGV